MHRKRLSLAEKLQIMARQARCPICQEKLGPLQDVEFDHEHALALGGADAIDNIRAVHKACHGLKTVGPPATSAGSDVHLIAKEKRLTLAQVEFRRRMLMKLPEEPKPGRPKGRWRR